MNVIAPFGEKDRFVGWCNIFNIMYDMWASTFSSAYDTLVSIDLFSLCLSICFLHALHANLWSRCDVFFLNFKNECTPFLIVISMGSDPTSSCRNMHGIWILTYRSFICKCWPFFKLTWSGLWNTITHRETLVPSKCRRASSDNPPFDLSIPYCIHSQNA